jgi:hypothetical protein
MLCYFLQDQLMNSQQCLCTALSALQEPVSSSTCFAGLLDQGHKAKQQLAQVNE